MCSHCGKFGYTVDTCYKKHGFPPHFKFKNQNYDQSNSNVVFQNDNHNVVKQDIEGLKADMQSQQFGFIVKQYQRLLALLQQSQSSNNVSNQVSVIPSTATTFVHNESSHNVIVKSSFLASWVEYCGNWRLLSLPLYGKV
ncbi:hypothetical protein RJT34_25149 [Clitoria ternatea]|uniref:Uncharacterized protein n=1 Tax=Clitoria ternatea TaxID=43366 RepID=A0AAN9II82_CLITE